MKHKKRRPGKRIVSLLLSLSMTLSGMPVTAEELYTEAAIETEAVEIHTEAAADTEVPLPEVTEAPVQEVTEASVQESTETPVQEATEAALVQTEAPQQEPETETPVQTEAVTEALQQTETLIPEQDVVEEPETDAAEEYETPTDETEQMTESDTAKTIRVQIGEVGYETLAEALEAAQSGDVITLVEDIATDDDLTIPAGVTVLIPEGRSFTISKETKLIGEAEAALDNQGTLLLTSGEDCDVDIYNGSGKIRIGTDPDEEAGIFYEEIHYEQNKELYFRCKICGSTEQKTDLDFRQELLKRFCPEGLEEKSEEEKEAIDALAEQSLAKIEFIIEEAATLTIQENKVLDLSDLSAEHISIRGTLINYGVLYLSAAAPGTIPVQGAILNYGIAEGLEEEQETEEMTEGATEEADVSEAVDAVRAMIDALPEASELESMGEEELDEVYMQAQEAYDAYGALTEEEQTELAEELIKLEELFGYLNAMLMPTSILSNTSNGFVVSADSGDVSASGHSIAVVYEPSVNFEGNDVTVSGKIAVQTPNNRKPSEYSVTFKNFACEAVDTGKIKLEYTYLKATYYAYITITRAAGHSLDSAKPNGDDTHSGTCSFCGRTNVTGNCSYDDKGVCTLCGGHQSATLSNGVYRISNQGQLLWFMEYVNKGNKSANAILMADIDMKGYDWTSIASTGLYYSSSYSSGNYSDSGYAGTFNGNNHAIRNLSVTSVSGEKATYGLFGSLSGTVKNLGIEGFTYTHKASDMRVGAIVGQILGGKVQNCYVTNATITPGTNVAGGLAGCNYAGTIESCYVYNSNVSAGRYGYLVADNRADASDDRIGTLKNCYTDGEQLVGKYTGTETDCAIKSQSAFASGEVTYLLNGSVSSGNLNWYQTCGTGLPAFSGSIVYQHRPCIRYSNEEGTYEHKFDNGVCLNCGEYEAANLVDGVYQIANMGQLLWYGKNGAKMSAELIADITIGTQANPYLDWEAVNVESCGIFDGKNHTVTMYITYSNVGGTSGNSYAGLLNGNYMTVQNLTLKGSITCNTTGLVGAVNATGYGVKFYHIISYVDIINEGTGYTGGLVGYFGQKASNGSVINNCAVYADISGAGYTGGLVGVGWNGNQYWSIRNSAFYGSVGGSQSGAIIGYSRTDDGAKYCKITNCYYPEGMVSIGGADMTIGSDTSAAKSEIAFKSGEVTRLLNSGNSSNDIWRQTIGVHDYPCFEGDIVYNASGYQDTENLISFGVTWKSMEFTYHVGSWDPDTHSYRAEEGYWSPDETNGGVIKINNLGSAINVILSYQSTLEGTDGVFSVSEKLLGNGKSFSSTLTLTGKPSEQTAADGHIGTVRIAVERKSDELAWEVGDKVSYVAKDGNEYSCLVIGSNGDTRTLLTETYTKYASSEADSMTEINNILSSVGATRIPIIYNGSMPEYTYRISMLKKLPYEPASFNYAVPFINNGSLVWANHDEYLAGIKYAAPKKYACIFFIFEVKVS